MALCACSDRAPSTQSSGSVALSIVPPARRSSAPSSSPSSLPPAPRPSAPTAAPSGSSPPSAPTLAPLPPVAEVKQLLVVEEASDPLAKDCGGVRYRITVDLSDNAWIYAACEKGPDEPKGAASLKVKNGKLAPAQRSTVDALYAKVARRPSNSCGADGEPILLSITSKDESSIKLADENWRCVKPPPDLASGLRELAEGLLAIVKPPK